MFGGGARRLFEKDPELKNDPRFKLYPEWMQQQVAQMANLATPNRASIRRRQRQDGAWT